MGRLGLESGHSMFPFRFKIPDEAHRRGKVAARRLEAADVLRKGISPFCQEVLPRSDLGEVPQRGACREGHSVRPSHPLRLARQGIDINPIALTGASRQKELKLTAKVQQLKLLSFGNDRRNQVRRPTPLTPAAAGRLP